jgi:general secretion pathway protein D
MRKIYNILLMAICGCVSAGATVIAVAPPSGNVSVGDVFTTSVNVDNISDLYAFQFDLTFDPSMISAISVLNGLFLSSPADGTFIPGAIDKSSGLVSATADFILGPGPGVTGDGTLAIFQFTALKVGMSLISVPSASVILLDSNLNDIPFTTSDGSVVVNPATGVPEPSTTFLTAFVLSLGVARGFLSRGMSRVVKGVNAGRTIVKVRLQ